VLYDDGDPARLNVYAPRLAGLYGAAYGVMGYDEDGVVWNGA